MKKMILSLGSNMSDRRLFLQKAAAHVESQVGRVVRRSSVRESEAWGFVAPPFLNQVLEVQTDLSPEQVLAKTQQIERALGRTEKTRYDCQGQPVYSDRPIDIDLLWFEDECRDTPQLILPHPRIPEREFILVLLVELYDNQILPPFTSSFEEMLAYLK
jgi:2-amino-4-hydroxy-6-hydroxymethyldihydropteridine diphosphokinase